MLIRACSYIHTLRPTYISTYIYIHEHICINIYMYIQIYIYVCVFVFIFICMHICNMALKSLTVH